MHDKPYSQFSQLFNTNYDLMHITRVFTWVSHINLEHANLVSSVVHTNYDFMHITRVRNAASHAWQTLHSVSCWIYGKTRAKYTTDAQPQQCQYAIIPCFYVCYENVVFFTVFYRIKWTFHKIAFLHVFYRVNHKRGSQTGPPNGPHLKYFGIDLEFIPVFCGAFSYRHQKTHLFYRVKWL